KRKKQREFMKTQWIYDSMWSSKKAILAGNKEIKLEKLGSLLMEGTREENFLDNWKLQINENRINIVGGNFNVNIDPTVNREVVEILKEARIVEGWDQAKLNKKITDLESKIAEEGGNPDLELINLDIPDITDPKEIVNHIKEQYAELYATEGVDWSIIEELT
ncbi:9662_t:CDS:2, partial [Gigaspora rosea]